MESHRSKNFLLLSQALPAQKAINLIGRVVGDPCEPLHNYAPKSDNITLQQEVISTSSSSASGFYNQHADLDVQAHLGKLLNIEASHENDTVTVLVGKEIVTRQMEQHGEAFRNLYEIYKGEIDDLLQTNQKSKRMGYMVTGIKSLKDGRMGQSHSASSQATAEATAPLDAVAQMAAGSPPLPSTLTSGAIDLSAALSSSSRNHIITSGTVEGEQVFALQYCSIKFKKHRVQVWEAGRAHVMQVADFKDGILGRDNEDKKPVVNNDMVKSSKEEEGEGFCLLGDEVDDENYDSDGYFVE